MNYGEIKYFDVANGPGIRTSLFVSGCTHHCKNCFNAKTWDFNYGEPFTDRQIDDIITSLMPEYVNGFTLLGGEPFEPVNQKGILPLLRRIKKELPSKSIWIFTGYLFDREIIGEMVGNIPETEEILKLTDVIIDGRFVEELKNLNLKFKGSSNQRTIDVQKSLKTGNVELVEGY
ncbi:MAG: anaerobic ribonucleoside-triphosphate reductase activating protein [Clostridiales bacterium]|nr:anaerobic ribonucleoside-triphosphate reductase activating protein [Clostridiales bacterium]